ncbi:MAG: hypothetical protein ACFFCS_24260 [Candidatus Hodarchaeota archaeon]
MKDTFLERLQDLQPSQLYINSEKLKTVHEEFDPIAVETFPPIPVIKLDGKITMTDGHTRAFAAYQVGLEKVKVYWDEDELDLEMYAACVGWCKDEGITSVADLESRVIDSDAYNKLWIERCAKLEHELND